MSYSQAYPPTLYIAEHDETDDMFNTFIDHNSLDEPCSYSTPSSGPCTFAPAVPYTDVPCFNPHCFDVINQEIEKVSALERYTPSLSPVDGSCASWSSQDGEFEPYEHLEVTEASMILDAAAISENEMPLDLPQAELSDLTDLSDLEEMDAKGTKKRSRAKEEEGEDSDSEMPLMQIWKRQKMDAEASLKIKIEEEPDLLPAKLVKSKKGKRKGSLKNKDTDPVQSTGQADFRESYKKLQAALHPQAARWSRAFLLNYAADTITSLRDDAVRLESAEVMMKGERDQAIFLAERAEVQLKLFLKEETKKEKKRKAIGKVRFAV